MEKKVNKYKKFNWNGKSYSFYGDELEDLTESLEWNENMMTNEKWAVIKFFKTAFGEDYDKFVENNCKNKKGIKSIYKMLEISNDNNFGKEIILAKLSNNNNNNKTTK